MPNGWDVNDSEGAITLAELVTGTRIQDEDPFDPHEVAPGQLDRRILDQKRLWVDFHGQVHELERMCASWRRNVLLHLHLTCEWMWMAAAWDELLHTPLSVAAEVIGSGHEIGLTRPHVWLESTPLVRQLRRLDPGLPSVDGIERWCSQVTRLAPGTAPMLHERPDLLVLLERQDG